jgi:hypothetical protein
MGRSCAASCSAYLGSAGASSICGCPIAAMYAIARICVSIGIPEPTVGLVFGTGRGGIDPSHVEAGAGATEASVIALASARGGSAGFCGAVASTAGAGEGGSLSQPASERIADRPADTRAAGRTPRVRIALRIVHLISR